MSEITLFDNKSLKEIIIGKSTRSDYDSLATSTITEYIAIRNMLEDWFTLFPSQGKKDLKGRFQSSNSISFQSAFFELILHELHLKLNAKVTLHKETETEKTTVPDFYIVDSNSCESYVEATVVTGKSKKRQAEEERLTELLKNLNRMIVSRDYWLALESQGFPKKPPSAKKIASELNKNIDSLEINNIKELFINKKYNKLPKWSFNANGCVLIFEPIPILDQRKSSSSPGPIVIHSGEVEFVDHRTPIRRAVTRKAKRYGKLSCPFVVAINCLEFVDEIDVMNALFGQEQFQVPINPNRKITEEDIVFSRIRNGAWTNPIGPRYSRISGVLVAINLRPWSIHDATICLYHNPWASQEYTSVLNNLNQSLLIGDKMRLFKGKSLSDILDIESYKPF